jgi:hypothetical protein
MMGRHRRLDGRPFGYRPVAIEWPRSDTYSPVADFEAPSLGHACATLRRSNVVADGARPSRFVHKLEPRLTEARHAGRTGQEIAGIPIIARNSSVVFVTGNGSLGTLRPSRSQIGSQPSAGDHSNRRSPGTPWRTASLCRS